MQRRTGGPGTASAVGATGGNCDHHVSLPTDLDLRTGTAGDPIVDRAPWRDRLHRLIMGPSIGEDVSPHRVELPATAHHESHGPVRRYGRLVASAAAGLAGATLIVATAPVWRLAAPSWRLTIPGLPHPGSSLFNGAAFVIGVILMGLGWIGLIGRAERQPGTQRTRLWMVAGVFALWCVPVLLGPPLLSHDAYSYAAQGEMASRGIDPTANGPAALGRGEFLRAADPIWRTAPAPYGPVSVEIAKVTVEVTGHDAAAAVWGFRALAMAGVVMAAFGVAIIAKSHGVSPAIAVAVGIANPLVLLHLVGGSHNDALMLGLLTLGLAALSRDRRALGVVIVALAIAVKLPAALALPYVGWTWYGPGVEMRKRVKATAMVTAASAGVIAVLCATVGVGSGWVTALKSTGKVTSTFSATTKLGYVASDLIHWIGLDLNADMVVSLFRLAGMALVGLIALVVLLRSPQLGLVRSVGLVMVAFVILGPVVWPWYFPAGFALLAAVGLGRYRPSYLVVVFAASLLVWPTSVGAVPSLSRFQHVLGLLVVAAIAAAAFGAQRLSDWNYRRRADRAGLEPDEPDRTGAVEAIATASS